MRAIEGFWNGNELCRFVSFITNNLDYCMANLDYCMAKGKKSKWISKSIIKSSYNSYNWVD